MGIWWQCIGRKRSRDFWLSPSQHHNINVIYHLPWYIVVCVCVQCISYMYSDLRSHVLSFHRRVYAITVTMPVVSVTGSAVWILFGVSSRANLTLTILCILFFYTYKWHAVTAVAPPFRYFARSMFPCSTGKIRDTMPLCYMCGVFVWCLHKWHRTAFIDYVPLLRNTPRKLPNALFCCCSAVNKWALIGVRLLLTHLVLRPKPNSAHKYLSLN